MKLEHDSASLPSAFYARVDPTPVPEPRLLLFNAALAGELGLDPAEWTADVLVGNRIPAGATPVALAYAGHQFGHFVPQLGDGRAILLGELRAPDGTLWDVHLKGAGRTPFSRGGDGRAWVGPALRELIVSEAMHALGVPTTRALAVATTGAMVLREQGPLPGAVLVRLARGHVRVGTFEYFAARGDVGSLRALLDHLARRHGLPYRDGLGLGDPVALLDEVAARQAALVARWMALGFVHGVMNTDNCAVLGDTIDYGPCAFVDDFRHDAVFSAIDRFGRYAFDQQPRIAHWNLAALARTLTLLTEDVAGLQAALDAFPARFAAARLDRAREKLGLGRADPGDEALYEALLDGMAASGADFTATFRDLCALGEAAGPADAVFLARFPAAADWLARWRARLRLEDRPEAARQAAMRAANPSLIPRNHRIEQAIHAAVAGDVGPAEALFAALARPYDDPAPEHAHLAAPPGPGEAVTRTFCGT